MKDTVEQIVEKYIANPTRENMHEIADYNGCTVKEIGQLLKEAATPKKRSPGRPKGKSSQSSNLCSSDTTKKRASKKVSNKVEPIESDARPKTYLIPPVVESMAREKAEELRKLRDIHESKARELQLEIDEIIDFLNGGFSDGAKE